MKFIITDNCKAYIHLSNLSLLARLGLFLILSTYGFNVLHANFSFINISAFPFFDELTGKPYLLQRICYFICSITLYLLFTLVLDKEERKFALFYQSSLKRGLIKGACYALVVASLVLFLLALTKIVVVEFNVGKIWPNIFNLILAWVIAQFFNAIKEEIIFRGYLLRRLKSRYNKHFCVIVVSIIFGAGHYAQYNYFGAVFATVAGVIFGYLYIYYNNIYVPIAMHAVWDVCSHTILAGKILAFNMPVYPIWVGISNETMYFIISIVGLVLFLTYFFLKKKLWLL